MIEDDILALLESDSSRSRQDSTSRLALTQTELLLERPGELDRLESSAGPARYNASSR